MCRSSGGSLHSHLDLRQESLQNSTFLYIIGLVVCRSRGGSLHSDLDLPKGLREFWFPAAFSSQLKEGAMVTMELFGEPWVMFRDAQGQAACVKDACAHRACPLSLVGLFNCILH